MFCDPYTLKVAPHKYYYPCQRTHYKYSMCHYHWVEKHKGEDFKTCKECKDDFDSDLEDSENAEIRIKTKKAEILCHGCKKQITNSDDIGYWKYDSKNKKANYYCKNSKCVKIK